jgi:erythromycin esterase
METATTDTPTEWIRHHAHPLVTLDPDGLLTELVRLRKMVRDARVVALGVSARDTHELLFTS